MPDGDAVTRAREAYDRARDRLDSTRGIEFDVATEEAAVEGAWRGVVEAVRADERGKGGEDATQIARCALAAFAVSEFWTRAPEAVIAFADKYYPAARPPETTGA